MSESLSHVLEMYRLVTQQNNSPIEAAKEVGRQNNLNYSTLLSSCTRDLNISSDQLDHFLRSRNNYDFKNFLIRRFPSNRDQIVNFFNSFEDTSEIPVLDMSKIVKPSLSDEKKILNSQIIVSSLREQFLDWITRDDIPHDIKEELKNWINKIKE